MRAILLLSALALTARAQPTGDAAAVSVDATGAVSPDASPCTPGLRVLVSERRRFQGAPPKEMPADLSWAYTRCGAIPVEPFYVDDAGADGKGTHYKYDSERIRQLVASARQLLSVPNPLLLGKRGWLAEALRHPAVAARLPGARVVVFGSTSPIVETLVLGAGAAQVTTVEYNRLTYSEEGGRISTVTPDDARADSGTHRHAYDIALSISSFDHDGLGRYGDPLCPDGDLLAVDEVRQFYLKQPRSSAPGQEPSADAGAGSSANATEPGPADNGAGVLLLTVPVGPDVVGWNLMRRYGQRRLPLLTEGYATLGRVGWHERRLTALASLTSPYEPVLILQPVASAADANGGAAEEPSAPAAASAS